MPRTKWILNKHELIEHAARAAQLRAMGVDINVPRLPLPAPTVDFEVGSDYNRIFNSSALDVTLAISVRILPRRSGIYLADEIDVTVPFDTSTFEFWSPTGRDNKYWVGRNLSLEYAEVLNHRLQSGLRLVKGKAVSGLLLLYAQGQLPAEYRQGARMNVNLTFFDSLGTGYGARAVVSVHRPAESNCRSKIQTANTGTKSTLYEEAPRSGIVQNVQSSSVEESPALSAERRKQMEMEMKKQELASWRRKLAGPLELLRQGTPPSNLEEVDRQNLIYLASTAEPSPSDSIPGRAQPRSAPTKTELHGSKPQEPVKGWGQTSGKPAVNFMEELARCAADSKALFRWDKISGKPAVNFMEEMERVAAETDAFFSAVQKKAGRRRPHAGGI